MVRLVVAAVVVGGCSFTPGAIATRDGGGSGKTFLDAPPPLDAAPAGWWNPAFRWRIPISIENTSLVSLGNGYQVGLAYDVDAAPCSGNRDDIRIVHGMTELPRVIDEVGTVEWTWFKLQASIGVGASSNAGDYWLYCGNPAPPAAPADPTQVFDFFDDFNGSALGAAWVKQGDVTVANGAATVGGGGTVVDSGLHSTATYGAGRAIDVRARVADPATPNFWAGFQNGFPDQPPWLHWYAHVASVIAPDYWASSGGTQWYGTNRPLDAAYHLYSVENYGLASLYRLEDVVADTHIYDQPPSPTDLNLRLHNYSSTTKVDYDMVRVRHAIGPPPNVTAGTPETY